MKKIILLITLFTFYFIIANSQILLDPSFGINGIVKADIGTAFNYSNSGRQVLIKTDGSMYFIIEAASATLIEKKHADGTPDITYGNRGTSVTVAILDAHAVFQNDGKIVIAGHSSIPDDYNQQDYAVARFNEDGNLDDSFGVNGVEGENIYNFDEATCLGIQSDGKIIIAGYSVDFSRGLSYFAMVRFNTNGSEDNSFGNSGYVATDFGIHSGFDGSQGIYSIAFQSDGKILAEGYIVNGGSPSSAIARYDSDGLLDSSFNGIGYRFIDFDPNITFTQMVLQNDGKILVGGSGSNGTDDDFAIARLNADGSPDNSFDLDGIQTTDFAGSNDIVTTMSLQNDGKIILAGHSSNGTNDDFAICRYNSDGSLDNTLNSIGKKLTDFGSVANILYSIAVGEDGKLVALGQTVSGDSIYVAASGYNTDGTPDISFGGNGLLTEHITQGNTHYTSTAIQSDGKIITAGYTWNGSNYDFALARYNTNGIPDNSFGNNGIVITDFGATDDKIRAIALQSDNKILVAGSSGNDIAICRYNSDGNLDNTFNGNGRITKDLGSSDSATSIAVQMDGKIIVAGTALLRYNTNGTLDASFNGTGIVSSPTDCGAVIIQNEKILVGSTDLITRYNSDGSVDNAFGGFGNGTAFIFISDPNYVHIKSLAIQNDGKIIAAGDDEFNSRGIHSSFFSMRLSIDGIPDSSFGSNSIVITQLGFKPLDYGTSLAIQNDNKIILAGYSSKGVNDNFAILRYNADGMLDNGFGENGVEISDVSTANNKIAAITLSGDNLYAAGYGQYPGNFGVVAKYLLSSGGPLPVTFTNFTAELKNKSVLLQWQTASEHNLSNFIIERSADVNHFSPIGNVSAVGNSSIKINYTTFDKQPLHGANFYRLKIFDIEGKFTYSRIVLVNNNNQIFSLRIFPNPASNILFVQATGENQEATFQIIDAGGRRLNEGKVTLNGNTSFSVDINNLPMGIYNLELHTNEKIETLRFVKE